MAKHRKPVTRTLNLARATKLATIAAASALLLGACDLGDKISEPWQDAPRGEEWNGPMDTVTGSDGFSNIGTKCGPGQNRYSVIFHGDSPYGSISVIHDPSCPANKP
jgi:hypothetical protein